jgi:hypothetical protein
MARNRRVAGACSNWLDRIYIYRTLKKVEGFKSERVKGITLKPSLFLFPRDVRFVTGVTIFKLIPLFKILVMTAIVTNVTSAFPDNFTDLRVLFVRHALSSTRFSYESE